MNGIVRWGVIGCGGIAARRTIPEVMLHVANARIVAVMDLRSDIAESVAARFGIQHVCRSEEEFLGQEIDAVYIATPPYLHCDQAVRAAGAGKHILCEKPLCLGMDEANQMETAAARHGVSLMPAYCMRFNENHIKARELVQSGRLGRLVMARAQLTCWFPEDRNAWRQDISLGGGGSFIDMGTHCLDLLEWIGGERVVEVCAMHEQLVHAYRTPVEDLSTVQVRFAGHSLGIVDTSFCVPDAASKNRLELYFSGGSILASGTIGQEPSGSMSATVRPQGDYAALQNRDGGLNETRYECTNDGIYAGMVKAFSQSILERVGPPITPAEGVHLVQATIAVNRSVEQRRIVRVDEA